MLEREFAETVEARPELVARHYTEASLAAQAVGYWLNAGERAVQLSANVGALAHLNKGLELLRVLPANRDRARREL